MRNQSLSIVVPAYNESANIRGTLEQLDEACQVLPGDYEIIVVDDGSTDETLDIVKAFACSHSKVRYLKQANRGFGAAYMRGLSEAKMLYCIMVPGDNAYPARSLTAIFSRLGQAELICSYTANQEVRPWPRQLISYLFTGMMNTLFGLRLKYYNGICLLPTRSVQLLPLSSGFAYSAQTLIYLIRGFGLGYREVGVDITERAVGKSKAFQLKNIYSVVRTILRLFWEIHVKRKVSQNGELEALRPRPGSCDPLLRGLNK